MKSIPIADDEKMVIIEVGKPGILQRAMWDVLARQWSKYPTDDAFHDADNELKGDKQ